jgi:parvulin-like peptidyl-prolyl isomerase
MQMLNAPKIYLISGILATSLLFGCSGGLFQGGQVATINGEVITQAEFQKNYTNMLRLMNLDPDALKDSEYSMMVTTFKKMALQNLILNSLVKQEADKLKIAVTEAELGEAYNMHVSQLGGEKSLNEQLSKIGLSRDDFKSELRDQLLRDKLITAISGNKAEVTEEQARAYYEKNPGQFDRPEEVRARHILVSADPVQIQNDARQLNKNASDQEIDKQIKATIAEKRKKAEQLYTEVKAKPNKFEDIAKKSSDDKGSAVNGGDLGYFSYDLMVPPFSEAAFKTKPGQIHEKIVESPFGFHIIQVVDRRAPETRKFEDVKTQIVTYLKNQRKNQLMEAWLEDAKKKAEITIAPEYDFEKLSKEEALPAAQSQ